MTEKKIQVNNEERRVFSATICYWRDKDTETREKRTKKKDMFGLS